MPANLATNNSTKPILVGWWLLLCCSLVLIMVILGGITRLTQSGLSMVEWQPLSLLPPLSNTEWQNVFTSYQKFPEYRIKNIGMTLDNFRIIFWLEYIHRLVGRLISLVFLVPFLWFLVRRQINRGLVWKLASLFLLGGTQGVIGWLMVKSGLANKPDVSQYYLVIHLGFALLIYSLMLWVALGVLQPRQSLQQAPIILGSSLWSVLSLVVLTLLSGGLVAGLDAGSSYNTFPLMDGRLVPNGLLVIDPWYMNLFENVVTAQFQHRLLAVLTFCAVLFIWKWSRHLLLSIAARRVMNLFVIMTIIQVTLGILTLLMVVPTPLAVAHQASAFILFTVGLLTIHTLQRQVVNIS